MLAHGAGAGIETPFFEAVTRGLVEGGCRVVRFEFPYMAERRRTGKKRPPDREPVLRDAWLSVLDGVEDPRPVIGGKSLGGRMASLIADQVQPAGLVCLGYPFHPSGKPERLRTSHLRTIATPTLIVQGERDALGSREEVAGYELSRAVRVEWLPDGDHGFVPRKRSGHTWEENLGAAVKAVLGFVDGLGLQRMR